MLIKIKIKIILGNKVIWLINFKCTNALKIGPKYLEYILLNIQKQ